MWEIYLIEGKTYKKTNSKCLWQTSWYTQKPMKKTLWVNIKKDSANGGSSENGKCGSSKFVDGNTRQKITFFSKTLQIKISKR